MKLSRIIEKLFVGRDMREEKDSLIAEQKAIIRQNTQVVQSGARLVQHMSGMLKLMAEEHVEQ